MSDSTAATTTSPNIIDNKEQQQQHTNLVHNSYSNGTLLSKADEKTQQAQHQLKVGVHNAGDDGDNKEPDPVGAAVSADAVGFHGDIDDDDLMMMMDTSSEFNLDNDELILCNDLLMDIVNDDDNYNHHDGSLITHTTAADNNDGLMIADYETRNAVCFGWINHPGTKRWRSIVAQFSGDQVNYPTWSDNITFHVLERLRQEGISLMFISDSKANNKSFSKKIPFREGRDTWRPATEHEILERTKQRFRDDRKVQQRMAAKIKTAPSTRTTMQSSSPTTLEWEKPPADANQARQEILERTKQRFRDDRKEKQKKAATIKTASSTSTTMQSSSTDTWGWEKPAADANQAKPSALLTTITAAATAAAAIAPTTSHRNRGQKPFYSITTTSVCFEWTHHPGTIKWRELVKTFADDTHRFPEWRDSIVDLVEDKLNAECGLTHFLVFLDSDGNPTVSIHNGLWFEAKKEEIIIKTKQQFLQYRGNGDYDEGPTDDSEMVNGAEQLPLKGDDVSDESESSENSVDSNPEETQQAPKSSSSPTRKRVKVEGSDSAIVQNNTNTVIARDASVSGTPGRASSVQPTDSDVCFGWIKHPGTRIWRDVIKLFSDDIGQYQSWSDNVYKEIAALLQEQGIVRFLVCLDSNRRPVKKIFDDNKQCTGMWYVAEDQDTVEKTKQRFLNNRKSRAGNNNMSASTKRPRGRPSTKLAPTTITGNPSVLTSVSEEQNRITSWTNNDGARFGSSTEPNRFATSPVPPDPKQETNVAEIPLMQLDPGPKNSVSSLQ